MIDGAARATSLAFTLGRKHTERTDNGARMLAAPTEDGRGVLAGFSGTL